MAGDKDGDTGVERLEKEMKEMRSDVKEMLGEVKGQMAQVLLAMEKFEALTTRVDENDERVQSVEDNVKKLDEMVKEGVVNVNELKANNMTLLKRIRVLEDKMEKQEETSVGRVSKLEERLGDQEKKAVDLEARGRRRNLIFHGIEEKEGEKDDDCMATVKTIIKQKCKVTKAVVIERAHRIPPGPRKAPANADKPRPIVVAFHDYNDRVAVKAGRANFPTDCGIGISDDLPFAVRQARRRLHDELDKQKAEGKSVWISFPARLFVDGVCVREEPIGPEDIRQKRSNHHASRRDDSERRDDGHRKRNRDDDELRYPRRGAGRDDDGFQYPRRRGGYRGRGGWRRGRR